MCDPLDIKTNKETGLIKDMHPTLLSTIANTDDNPRWEQAMNNPTKEGHWEASQKEVNTLIEKGCWELVD